MQSSKKSDDGKIAKQSFSWDPSAGQIKAPEVDPPAPPAPEPEPEVDPEPEPESETSEESESTCEEEEDCGCCNTDVCPDLTYYDQQIAKQAADFMAHVRAGKAEVEYGLTEHEAEEFEKDLTQDMLKDLANEMKEDSDFIDSVPQKLANMSAIAAIEGQV